MVAEPEVNPNKDAILYYNGKAPTVVNFNFTKALSITESTEEHDLYANDGTVNISGKPALRKQTGGWKACYFILGNVCFERLAYYGLAINLVNYLQHNLNQGNVTASNNVNNWTGTCFITTIIGAFIDDAYLGRYWTIAIFLTIYIIGMALFALSTVVPGLKPWCDSFSCHPTSAQSALCFVALYLVALGSGGMKPCVSTFGADQFDETHEVENQSRSSFFNWMYFSSNVGPLIASSVLIWIQMSVSWELGFGIPVVILAIAALFFFSGSNLYRLQKPKGSPFTTSFQVIVSALRKFDVEAPTDKPLLYEIVDENNYMRGSHRLDHTDRLQFFDKAAVETQTDRIGGIINPWRLCTVTQVEELKAIVSLLPILGNGILFATVYNQIYTMFVLQGNTMDQHIGGFKIPSASLTTINMISVLLWTVVYDQVIVPCARTFTGNERGFTQLQRMGIGFVISVISMIAAGIVEVFRLDYVHKNNYYDAAYVPISIFWQVPQHMLIGCAEVFTIVGQLEFFYDQAPNSMRSMCTGLLLTTIALGSYLSTLLVTIVDKVTKKEGKLGWIPDNLNRGHLDYFYWFLAILSLLNFFSFLWTAKWYTYKNGTRHSQ